MRNDLFMKLRCWEKDDKAETTQSKFIGGLERLLTLRTRLDILLGAVVTTIIICLGLLIAHGVKVI